MLIKFPFSFSLETLGYGVFNDSFTIFTFKCLSFPLEKIKGDFMHLVYGFYLFFVLSASMSVDHMHCPQRLEESIGITCDCELPSEC